MLFQKQSFYKLKVVIFLLSLHNQGWKFRTNKSNLKIEKNLYFANYDKNIESQCIVIEGKLNESLNKIEWSLEKTNK